MHYQWLAFEHLPTWRIGDAIAGLISVAKHRKLLVKARLSNNRGTVTKVIFVAVPYLIVEY
ncbi:hypothetical protein FD49_GL001422 [Latilactobacillus sakei subsp. sakei DSM 20017 = JCM 1157]|nr:hypothetical protein FD49_GL001422 [Latilactobacillus sakei subsp. sakei DSM 20017 = JCM 1157]